LLVSDGQVCEIYEYIFGKEVAAVQELEEVGNMDFLYYDCADKSHKGAEHHRVAILKEHTEKIYQKPAGNILVALFSNIEALHASGEQKSENSLLRIFEDVPEQVFILVTSRAPQKIIPTLQSRMIMLAPSIIQ
jgi:DNA polymerase III delta prime subunit